MKWYKLADKLPIQTQTIISDHDDTSFLWAVLDCGFLEFCGDREIELTEYPKINSTLLKIIRKPEKRPPIPQPPDVIRKLFYLMQFRYWKHHDKMRTPKKQKPQTQQIPLL